MLRYTFSKQERISGKKQFEVLVKEGKSFSVFPFRVVWMETGKDQLFPAQVAFAVPKRNFKSAVKRNRVKRILRESYRRNKAFFYQDLEKRNMHMKAMFIYIPRELPKLKETDGKIILTLRRLIKAADAGNDGHSPA